MTLQHHSALAETSASVSSTFLHFLNRGEFRIARDSETGIFVDFVGASGRRNSGLEWVAASGRGTLESFVVYHRQYHADFRPPYNVALIRLKEGPLLVSSVLAPPTELKTGIRLLAKLDESGLLMFVPVENSHA